MDWYEILGIILGSSAVTEIISWTFRKKQTDANIYDNFTRRLEERIGVLERRIDRLEARDAVFSSATACAYACRYNEECPVLRHLIDNPLPSKTHSEVPKPHPGYHEDAES